ncbi:HAD family hydrolase [Caproiciproducens sp. LBM24188]
MDLNGILVISDLDGTLIDRNYTVPERTLRAVERLKRAGGRFTVATGRSPESGRRYIEAVAPNSPGVILNGTLVYDFETGKILWQNPMNTSGAKECIDRIRDHFPETGIEVFATQGLGVVHRNEWITQHLSREGIREFLPDVFHGPVLCKAIFADEADVIRKIIDFTGTFAHEEVRFVTSSPHFLEMLPAKADKGSALRELMRICGYAREQVYAIGDYYNDLELLDAAGFAAVPDNAPDDLKQRADLVVCSCDEGAVGNLIEYLEQK